MLPETVEVGTTGQKQQQPDNDGKAAAKGDSVNVPMDLGIPQQKWLLKHKQHKPRPDESQLPPEIGGETFVLLLNLVASRLYLLYFYSTYMISIYSSMHILFCIYDNQSNHSSAISLFLKNLNENHEV